MADRLVNVRLNLQANPAAALSALTAVTAQLVRQETTAQRLVVALRPHLLRERVQWTLAERQARQEIAAAVTAATDADDRRRTAEFGIAQSMERQRQAMADIRAVTPESRRLTAEVAVQRALEGQRRAIAQIQESRTPAALREKVRLTLDAEKAQKVYNRALDVEKIAQKAGRAGKVVGLGGLAESAGRIAGVLAVAGRDSPFVKAINALLGGGIRGINALGSGIGGRLGGSVANVGGGLGGLLAGAGAGINNLTGGGAPRFVTPVTGLIGTIAQGAAAGLGAIGKITGALIGGLGKAVGTVGGVVSKLAGAFGKLGSGLASVFIKVISLPFSVIGAGVQILGGALQALGGIISGLFKAVGDVLPGLASTLNSLLGAAGNLIRSGFDAAKFANPAEARRFERAWADMTAAFGKSFTPVLEFMTKLIRVFGDFLLTIVPSAEAMTKLRKGLDAIVVSIRSSLEDLAPKVKGYLNALVEYFGELFSKLPVLASTAFDALTSKLSEAWQRITVTFTGLVIDIREGFLNARTFAAEFFDSVMKGLEAATTAASIAFSLSPAEAAEKGRRFARLIEDIRKGKEGRGDEFKDERDRLRAEREANEARRRGIVPGRDFKFPGLPDFGKILEKYLPKEGIFDKIRKALGFGAARQPLLNSTGIAPSQARFVSLEEYAKRSYEAAFGAGAQKPEERTAKNTDDIAKAAKAILAAVLNAGLPGVPPVLP